LNLVQISNLFGKDKSVISRHLKNIYDEGELDRDATVAKNATVQTQGKREVNREIEYYNSLTSDEATGLLKVVTDYTYALDVLDQYDHQVLEIHHTTAEELFQITYDEAMNAINGLRDKFGGSWLFGIPYHVQPSDSY